MYLYRAPTAFLIVLTVLIMLVVSEVTASSVHWIRTTRDQLALINSLGCVPQQVLDYRSFLWMQLSDGDLAHLETANVPYIEMPDAGTISVPGFRFDPLLDGEPRLPAKLVADVHGPGLRLVQLIGPARRDWFDRLQASGVQVLQYYPHHTYLVWDGGAGERKLDDLEFIRWQGRFQPAYAIDPDLSRAEVQQHVDILIHDNGRLASTRDALGGLGVRITGHYPARPDQSQTHIIAEVATGVIPAVARLSNVIWIGASASAVVFLDEMGSAVVAGNLAEGVPLPGFRTWLDELGYDGSGVLWSVNDSGVDLDHPDLEVVGGYTHGSCTQLQGDDDRGHGTAVAGILAGTGAAGHADSDGFLYGLGVAPGAALHSQTMCRRETDNGAVFAGSFQDLMTRVVRAGATGSNNSWTIMSQTGYQAISQLLDTMVRDSDLSTEDAEPHIMVFGAGNFGPNARSLRSPCEAKNVISVGGTVLRDWRTLELAEVDEIDPDSSRGPTSDGRLAPTVVAPSEIVISAQTDNPGTEQMLIQGTDGLYRVIAGTSAAAPHVSGAIAVMTEWWRDTRTGEGDPSPAMARALLVNSATDITGAPPIPNSDEGWGRVNLGRALQPGVPRMLHDQVYLLSDTGDRYIIDVAIPDRSEPLKVTVAWTDPAAAIRAAPTLVNDLDLRVLTAGETYLGNHMSDGWSVLGGAPDQRNNLENVFLQSHGTTATIIIEAARLAADGVPGNDQVIDQDFALVCSNCARLAQPRRAGRRQPVRGHSS
jgi:hypothetical protein